MIVTDMAVETLVEARTDPDLKGPRWSLLNDRSKLSCTDRADHDVLIASAATRRTARAWFLP